MNRGKLKIGIICGGKSGEHQVSLISAHHIEKSLDRDQFDVYMIGISKEGSWYQGSPEHFLMNIDDIRKVSFNQEICFFPLSVSSGF